MDRPHPNPLPQERENRPPRLAESDAAGWQRASVFDNSGRRRQQRCRKVQERAPWTPSPGGEGRGEGGHVFHLIIFPFESPLYFSPASGGSSANRTAEMRPSGSARFPTLNTPVSNISPGA